MYLLPVSTGNWGLEVLKQKYVGQTVIIEVWLQGKYFFINIIKMSF